MDYENLVFSGGGIKGVAYARIPKILDECGILKNIKRVAGTSAGSIAALLIALKYTPDQIDKIFSQLDFNNFIDSNLITLRLFRLLFKTGIQSGNNLSKWIQCKIVYKTKNPDITFKELYEYSKMELVIVAINFNTECVEYFSHKTSPDMPVWLAVRASASLPTFFEIVEYNQQSYIDGGILANFPIWVFDDPNSYEFNPDLINLTNEKTLGFRLISTDQYKTKKPKSYLMPIQSVIRGIINLMLNHIDSGYDVFDYSQRSVIIKVSGVKATDFSIDTDKLEVLKSTGETSTYEYLAERKERIKKLQEAINSRMSVIPKSERYGIYSDG
jgi:NTE family protein